MLYRRIDFDSDLENGFGENVQFVGVYVINWHKRSTQPEVAFVEADDPLVEAAAATQKALQDLYDDCVVSPIAGHVDGPLLDAANAALRLGKSKGMEKYG